MTCHRCGAPAFVYVHEVGDMCARHAREVLEKRLEIEMRPPSAPSDAPRALVTSVRIMPRGAHETVAIWNRGGYAGSITVSAGDAFPLAARLLGVAKGGE